jgi:hypothetical protein
LIGWFLVALIVVVAVEGFAYAAYRIVVLPRAGFLVYTPPESIDSAMYTDYLDRRDALLGWPIEPVPPEYDLAGSRVVPSFPQPGGDCVSLYGDSFVYAAEVDAASAWGNLMAKQLGCRVGNFGVGGYGTDQAFLRFERNAADVAPVTILGIYPHNVMRNVNQYRFFLTGGKTFGFKPRFILEKGILQLVPIPSVPADELDQLYRDPGKYLRHEAFLPDSPYGPIRASFPFTISLIRLTTKERIRNGLRGRPSWEAFWQPEHPTASLEVTTGIVSKFERVCKEREKRCLVLLFPTPSSYEWYAESGDVVTRFLIDELEKRSIPVLDLTVPLAGRLAGGNFCDLLTRAETCIGHFNAEGNRLVAQAVLDYFNSNHWLQPVVRRSTAR